MTGKDPLFRLTCSEKWIPLPKFCLNYHGLVFSFPHLFELSNVICFTNTPHNKHALKKMLMKLSGDYHTKYASTKLFHVVLNIYC